jgi:GNAT superfamily N-acetyltransferase
MRPNNSMQRTALCAAADADRYADRSESMECVLRDLSAPDVSALAAVHVQAFNETHAPHDGGPSLALRLSQWSETLSPAQPDRFVVGLSDPAGRLLGFAAGRPHDGGVPDYAGELNKIYVLREAHRRGFGRQLVAAVAERFLARAMPSMLLFGDPRSVANGFFEHLGAIRLLAPNGEFHGGYGWPDLEALLVRCRRAAP